MSDATFWRCTPNKLFAILGAHNKANSTDEEDNKGQPKQKVEKLTLEEAMSWKR